MENDKLVRLSKVYDVLQDLNEEYFEWSQPEADEIGQAIRRIPAVDAVEVVRCRECKMHGNCYAEDVFAVARLDDNKRFCGVGQRREDGDA